MKITPTAIPEVLLIEPDVSGDRRGFFMGIWHRTKYAYAPKNEHGIRWGDADIGIQWLGDDFSVSDKDVKNSLLKDMDARLPIYEGAA